MSDHPHPCDCCGHRTLADPPGQTGQICPVCFWEDSLWPDEDGRAIDGSGVDLATAQDNFTTIGACNGPFVNAVRPPLDTEPRDPAWRKIADQRRASADELRKLIRKAFRGVSRQGGVSLHETDAIDDYLDEAGCAAARALDTDRDWTQLKPEDLCDGRLQAANCFFDPIGYRYHLPAYLMCWLDGHADRSGSTVFSGFLWGWADMHPTEDLTESTSHYRERLDLLNAAQRYVVARFIKHLAQVDPDSMNWRTDAQKALANYWQTVLDAGPPDSPA